MHEHRPRKPLIQFGLASLFLAILVVALFAWLGREYYLLFGPREGLLWLAFVAAGGAVAWAFARWIRPSINCEKHAKLTLVAACMVLAILAGYFAAYTVFFYDLYIAGHEY